jgi:hypothetical protein
MELLRTDALGRVDVIPARWDGNIPISGGDTIPERLIPSRLGTPRELVRRSACP